MTFSRLLYLLLSLLGLSLSARAEELRGVLRKLDLEVGTLTVRVDTKDVERTVSLASKEVPLKNVLDQPENISTLKLGQHLQLKVEDDFVQSALVDSPAYYGTIRTVDYEKELVLIDELTRIRSVKLPEKVSILNDTLPGKVADLKVGKPIQVHLSQDRQTVLQVRVGKGANIRDPYHKLSARRGMLIDFDLEKLQVDAIISSYSDPLTRETLHLDSDCIFYASHHEKRLGILTPDQLHKTVNMTFWFDEESRTIVALSVDLPCFLRAKVNEYQPDTKQISFWAGKMKHTYKVSDSVLVQTTKGDAKLEDLKKDQIVNVLLTPNRARVYAIVSTK